MIVLYRKKKILTLVFAFLFAVTSLTPVSAGILSFLSERKPLPGQNLKNQDQIKSYNEQAIRLFEQGRFEEAQKLWEKAIQVMEGSMDEGQAYQEQLDMPESGNEKLALLNEAGEVDADDIDELYDIAVSLFQKQKYVASKKMFDRVEANIPDHKASRNYLTILDHKIKRIQQALGGGDSRKMQLPVVRKEPSGDAFCRKANGC